MRAICLILIALAAPVPLLAQAPVPQTTDAAARMTPEADAEYRKANAFLARRQFREAIDSLRKANKLSGGKCFLCLEAAAAASISLGEHADAIAFCREALRL